MEKLRLYEVKEEYTDYLRSKDDKVANEKKNRYKRKYIGVLIKIDDLLYLAPMSSFKTKHKEIAKSAVDVVKLNEMSVVNLNNMIPVKKSTLKPVIFKDIVDKKYRHLLIDEYVLINKKADEIIKKANRLYRMMSKKESEMNVYELALKKRCVNFKRLEFMSKYY